MPGKFNSYQNLINSTLKIASTQLRSIILDLSLQTPIMKKKLRDDISLDEIKRLYKRERDGRVKEKLLTIKLAYEGTKVSEIAQQLGVCQKTIYNWLDVWNQDSFKGLKPKHEKAGRKSYLTTQEWEAILDEIKDKNFKIKDIQEYVKKTRGKTYSYKAIWKILKHHSRT